MQVEEKNLISAERPTITVSLKEGVMIATLAHGNATEDFLVTRFCGADPITLYAKIISIPKCVTQ